MPADLPSCRPGRERLAKPRSLSFNPLERFQAKACPALDAGWIPVRVKKTRQNKKVEPRSDSIGTEKALLLAGLLVLLGAVNAAARSLEAIRQRGAITLCAHPN